MDEEDGNILRAEVTFVLYANYDIDIMTLELCIVDDLADDKLVNANLSFDEEECEEISPSSFEDAIDNIEKFRTCFVYQNTKEKTSRTEFYSML